MIRQLYCMYYVLCTMYCTVLYMDPGKAETEAATVTQEEAQEEEEGEEGVWERFSSDKRELREEYSTPRILGQVTYSN